MVSNNQSRKALWLAPDKIPSGSTTVIRPSSLHWSMALMRYRYSAGYFFDAGLPLKNGLDQNNSLLFLSWFAFKIAVIYKGGLGI